MYLLIRFTVGLSIINLLNFQLDSRIWLNNCFIFYDWTYYQLITMIILSSSYFKFYSISDHFYFEAVYYQDWTFLKASFKLYFYCSSLSYSLWSVNQIMYRGERYLISFQFMFLSSMMLFVVFFVSSFVILYSLDYISIYDYHLFFFYLILFELCMITFVLCNNLLISFFHWELLGLTSYLLINFWSNKNQCGIKAVVYNKVGDCFFLLTILLSFNTFFTFDLQLILFLSLHYSFSIHLLLFLALCTKSAQFPFSSWLIFAMSAPTPISALLHSSTMVIAGIYLGLLISFDVWFIFFTFYIRGFDFKFQFFLSIYFRIYFFFIFIPLITLSYSSFIAFFIIDIKSIIAFSTISQIGYMLLATLIIASFSIYHIIVHAFFKSLLFLLAAELIHINQANFQSIYSFKINSSLIYAYFLCSGSALIFSISKEGILHSSIILFDSFLIFHLAMSTIFY